MGNLISVDRYHLRLAWLMLLLGGCRFLYGLPFLFLFLSFYFLCFRFRFHRYGLLYTLLLLQTIHDGHTKTGTDEFGQIRV